MKQKNVFIIIFAFLAITLPLLPFLVSFNDVLTHAIENLGWYSWIQQVIVPYEIKMVGVLVKLLGIDFIAHKEGMTINNTYAHLSWNCIGWQSLLLLFITFIIGLKRKYTFFSKLETIIIGIIGTILVNLLRMAFTVVLIVVSRPLFAVVFHDYLAAIMTVVWLGFFWWFAYSFILEKKVDNNQ